MNFDPLKSRLDILSMRLCRANLHTASRGTLSECCWFFHMVSSCGKAFQQKKQADEVHLQRDTLVAKRIICNHVNYVGGINQVDVTCKELLLSATSARQKTVQLIP